ncbi:GyrI-like domain-containing protein [Nocardia sp. CA-128927]|uniref:GyrI-like domain-containing protein n=1 Tax=Nocardia sp. CA-128927 TaxID=3239975 RepID=UPI003D961C57
MISAPEPELTRIKPVVTAAVRAVVPVAGLRDFFDASFGALARTIAAQRLEIVSPAFGLYHGPDGDPIDIEVGFAVSQAVEPNDTVVNGSLPGGRVARVIHAGGFDELSSAWDGLHAWIWSRGLTPGDERWEVYTTQPSPEMDPADLRTELNWTVGG